jgi:hypothetical protein
MNSHQILPGSTLRGLISLQLAIVLTVIVGGAGILAYEWHAAHPAGHHDGAGLAHHHHKHVPTKTAANR